MKSFLVRMPDGSRISMTEQEWLNWVRKQPQVQEKSEESMPKEDEVSFES